MRGSSYAARRRRVGPRSGVQGRARPLHNLRVQQLLQPSPRRSRRSMPEPWRADQPPATAALDASPSITDRWAP
eukprot:COSAG01_NODE_37852_length_498_cov_0.636591_1_plen_73_part_10